jgi:hypothetical protein
MAGMRSRIRLLAIAVAVVGGVAAAGPAQAAPAQAVAQGAAAVDFGFDTATPASFELSNVRVVGQIQVGGQRLLVSVYSSSITGVGQPQRFGPMTLQPFSVSGTTKAGTLQSTCSSGSAYADPSLVTVNASCSGRLAGRPVSFKFRLQTTAIADGRFVGTVRS